MFIPADPRKPGTMEDAMRFIGALGNTTAVLDSLQPLELKNFDADWWMAPPRWIARRRVPAPVSPETDAGGTGATVQDSPSQAVVPAADMPAFLNRLAPRT